MTFLTPDTEAAVADIVRQAAADGTPLRLQGGGTRTGLGRLVPGATPLSLAGLSGITLYDPGALTLIARAGTPVAEIAAALESEKQELAFEPLDHRALLGTRGTPTIGGVVSANVSGPRRLRAGACRDHLLGLRFVDGQGSVIKNGGRVMKNVTGLDLSRLLCGAYGTLGVLTEVALKVLPRAERSATLVYDGLSDAAVVQMFCAALSTPFEVSGAAHVAGRSYLRIEGLADQVSYRIARLKSTFAGSDATVLEGAEHAALWLAIRDVQHFAQTPGAIWRLSVKPTDAPVIAQRLRQTLGAETSLDWGGGLIWACLPEAVSPEAVRAALAPARGHATLVRGPDSLRQGAVFHPEPGPIAALSAGLRVRFDPQNILNPGLMAA